EFPSGQVDPARARAWRVRYPARLSRRARLRRAWKSSWSCGVQVVRSAQCATLNSALRPNDTAVEPRATGPLADYETTSTAPSRDAAVHYRLGPQRPSSSKRQLGPWAAPEAGGGGAGRFEARCLGRREAR